jgi:YidC/Oxa1 family membrane protein insertase
MIFTWMPVVFTFMLASFPAGLVIYWAWNNTLSVLQQYVIMRRQGVEVNLFGNIMDTFRKKKPEEAVPAAAAALPKPANDTRPAKAKGKAGKPAKAKT